MMLWLGLILVIQVSILNPAVASDGSCPPSEYLNRSNICVPCSSCKDGPKQLVLRSCSGHTDTVCGTIYDLAAEFPDLPKTKKRKDQPATEGTTSISKRPSLRNNKLTFKQDVNDNDNVFNNVSNPDYENGYRSSRVDTVQAANKTKNNQSLRLAGKNINPNNESDHSMRYLRDFIRAEMISAKKFGFNTMGKHIKKDLSMSSSVMKQPENATSPSTSVKSTLNTTSTAKIKKATKSKSKKNLVNMTEYPISIMDTKFIINGEEKSQPFSFVHPHVENHRIYLEMEKDEPTDHSKASSTLFAAANSDKRPSKPSILIKNNFTTNKPAIPSPIKNNTDLLQFHKLIGGLAEVLSNSSNEKPNNESGWIATVNDNENGALLKPSVHDDDYLADGTDADSDDSDSDDEDEDDDDDEDSDDEDDDYDDSDDDDEEDKDEDEDSEDDMDTPDNNSLLGGHKKTKHPPFGTSSSSRSLSPDDDDDDDDGSKMIENDNDYGVSSEGKSSNRKWLPAETEVNVEPYSNSPDWQLLTLVSVVSACLLFFVFVNIYICIYMKKWKHMKSNFEADVEDLSVRINLMQHGGLEVDDQHYIKNCMTPLKSGQITEKSSRTSLREK